MENKLPISRLGKFFSQDDFDFNMKLGEEYLHGDLSQKLVLYRVDRTNTDIDNVYGEVGKDEIKFHLPVEFYGLVKIESPKNSEYNKGSIRYLEPGNLTVSVFIKHLDELNIDINYGDYIGYSETEDKIRYYTVVNDGKVVSDNKHTLYGFKPFYRTINCVISLDNEFRGI